MYDIDPFLFGITLNVVAGIGAFGMGFLDDRIGGKKVILISIAGLGAGVLVAAFYESSTVFWVTAVVIAALAGPNQAASRSLFGRFVPEDRENEFFGFYAFSGKFTAFLGPAIWSLSINTFGSMQIALGIVSLLFAIGAVLLLRVNEAQGIEASGRASYGDQLG